MAPSPLAAQHRRLVGQPRVRCEPQNRSGVVTHEPSWREPAHTTFSRWRIRPRGGVQREQSAAETAGRRDFAASGSIERCLFDRRPSIDTQCVFGPRSVRPTRETREWGTRQRSEIHWATHAFLHHRCSPRAAGTTPPASCASQSAHRSRAASARSHSVWVAVNQSFTGAKGRK